MREKISPYCAVSRIRARKWCHACGEQINKYAVVFYRADNKGKRYAWVHAQCIAIMMPENLSVQKRANIEKMGYRLITLCTPCSICSKHKMDEPMLNFHEFYIHESCKNALVHKVTEIIDKNSARIFAESI